MCVFQIFQLQKEILLMGELQQKYQEKINILQPQQNAKPEHDLLVTSLRAEIKGVFSGLEISRNFSQAIYSTKWDRNTN